MTPSSDGELTGFRWSEGGVAAKAAEVGRTPKRWRDYGGVSHFRQVLDCGSLLALWILGIGPPSAPRASTRGARENPVKESFQVPLENSASGSGVLSPWLDSAAPSTA